MMFPSKFTTTTTTKDDEIRIHLGANSRPISFEYYTENQGTQQTTSATYYYHYDLHGNVIRVTNSSGTTVISYTYDQLGTIVSETNSSSIYNPFTYMGEAQVIQDSEFDTSGSSPLTGLYSSGSGYYNPHTGTFLGGSGAPASANPSSTSAEEPTAQSTRPASQLGAHAAISASAGSVPSSAGCASSSDVSPAEPYEGLLSICTDEPPTVTEDPSKWLHEAGGASVADGRSDRVGGGVGIIDQPKLDYGNKQERKHFEPGQIPGGKLGEGHYPGDGHEECGDPDPIIRDVDHGMFNVPNPFDYYKYYKECMTAGKHPVPEDVYNIIAAITHMSPFEIARNLEFAAWGTIEKDHTYKSGDNSITVYAGTYLFGFKMKGSRPHFFWGPGKCSWSHYPANSQKSSSTLVGQEYSDEVGSDANTDDETSRGLAASWIGSWFGDEGTDDIKFGAVSNVGNMRIGIFGRAPAGTSYSTVDCVIIDIVNGSVSFNREMTNTVRQWESVYDTFKEIVGYTKDCYDCIIIGYFSSSTIDIFNNDGTIVKSPKLGDRFIEWFFGRK